PQVAAAPSSSAIEAAPNGTRLNQAVTNEVCLGCHSSQSLTKKLYDDTDLSLYISGDDVARSIHGQSGIACVQCHTNFDQKHGENPVQYPGFNAADRRDASLQLGKLCGTCHTDQAAKQNDSVHSRAQAAGNRDAAICTDCHTAHAVRKLTDPSTKQLLPDARIGVPQTCARCHNAIYEKYKTSVHGAALLQASNLDVPTCIDCHGVHNIPDPMTDAFRLKSPDLCAKCHTNAQIMDRYGISTQVLNTYVADFHGTTVTLFEKQSPDAPTNKPVCFDCHSIHDIARVDDPQKGLAIRENILKRCQVCHPTATSNFSSAWLSHYIPSQDKTPLVYFVNQFYQIFIPGVLGGMAVLVLLDISWRMRRRFRKPAPPQAPVAPAPDQSA
ncbi:MAG TPA: cytochrome c3 family protein, partial [Anaerolineae bacterium]